MVENKLDPLTKVADDLGVVLANYLDLIKVKEIYWLYLIHTTCSTK